MNPAFVLEFGTPGPAFLLLVLTALFVLGSIGLVVFVFVASRSEDEYLTADDPWE